METSLDILGWTLLISYFLFILKIKTDLGTPESQYRFKFPLVTTLRHLFLDHYELHAASVEQVTYLPNRHTKVKNSCEVSNLKQKTVTLLHMMYLIIKEN